jgi:hypothetical protein
MKMAGHKAESVYRRYPIVSQSDLREPGAKLAGVTTNGDTSRSFTVTHAASRNPGGKLRRLKRRAVSRTEASRNPVGLPDFKSGGPF